MMPPMMMVAVVTALLVLSGVIDQSVSALDFAPRFVSFGGKLSNLDHTITAEDHAPRRRMRRRRGSDSSSVASVTAVASSRRISRRRRRETSVVSKNNNNDDRIVDLVSATSYSSYALHQFFWNEGLPPPHKDSWREEQLERQQKSSFRKGSPTKQQQAKRVVVSDGTVVDDTATLVESLTQPLITKAVWQKLTGTEFRDHPDALLGPLADMGVDVALNDEPNEWIEWHAAAGGSSNSLADGAIHVWTGKTAKQAGYHGAKLPFIKTRSIIPLTVTEVVELMMDSTRIQTYNAWSVGRRDCWVRDGYTKIVKNRVEPPVGSKAMVSTTLLHARPAGGTAAGEGAWVIVSRAVGGSSYVEPEDEHLGQTHILLGVNVLQPVDDESCTLTAVTHAYSSTVPNMLAERLGVKGAIKFVKDLRHLKVPAH